VCYNFLLRLECLDRLDVFFIFLMNRGWQIYDTNRGFKGGSSFLIIYNQRSIGNNVINCDNTCKPDATVN